MFLQLPDGSLYIGSTMNQADYYSLCCTGSSGTTVSKCCTTWQLSYNVSSGKWEDPVRTGWSTQDCVWITNNELMSPSDDTFDVNSNGNPILTHCLVGAASCSSRTCDFWDTASCYVSTDPYTPPPVLGPPSAQYPSVFDKIYYHGTSQGRLGFVSACGCPPCVVVSGRITTYKCPGPTQVGTFEFTTIINLTKGTNAACSGSASVTGDGQGAFSVKLERRIIPGTYGGYVTQWYITVRGGPFMTGESTYYLLTGTQRPLTGCYQLGQNTSCSAAQAAGRDTYAIVQNLRVAESGGGCPPPPQEAQGAQGAVATATAAATMSSPSPNFSTEGDDVTKQEAQTVLLDAPTFNALPLEERRDIMQTAFQDGAIQTNPPASPTPTAAPAPIPTVMHVPDNAIETCLECADQSCPNITVCCGGQINATSANGGKLRTTPDNTAAPSSLCGRMARWASAARL